MSTGMIIDGCLGSEAIDSSGEILSVEGADISDVDKGTMLLNWEHSPGEQGAETIVGKVVAAKKIFKESDCENDRERMYWKQVKVPFIYGVCRLFDGAGHDNARAIAAIIRDCAANNEPLVCRYSVEGSTLEKEGNHLKESLIRRVAITVRPCNRTANSGIIEDPNAPAGYEKEFIKPKDILSFDNAEKSEFPHPMYARLGGAHIVECNPVIEEPVAKALSAGVPSGAPSTLTGGEALQASSMGKDWASRAVKAMRSYDKPEFKKEEFRAYLKQELPEASDEFLDHFVDVTHDYQIKRRQLTKKEKGAPKEKPAAKPKASPKKVAAKPTAAPVNEDEADTAVVNIPHGTIRGVPTEPMKMRGPHFDEATGILHTPKGSFPLYNPDVGFAVKEGAGVPAPVYKNGVLHLPDGVKAEAVPHNPPNPNFREIYNSKPIEDFHSGKVMPNWIRVHELTKAKRLPEEVAMHSAIFSMLSPNTPVRPHELMYAHMADTWEDLGIDPRDPDFKSARKHWLGKDQGTNYPRIAREYFQGHKDVHLSNDSEGKGRKAGELMSFMLGENKFKNIAQYSKLHSTLVDMVKRHGTDARAATAELMQLKHKQDLWKQTRRTFANKLKERAATELGLGNHHSEYVDKKIKEAKAKKLIDDRNGTAFRKETKDEATALGLKDDLNDYVDKQMAEHPTYGSYQGTPVPGLAPKTGRFTFTMMGGGNSFVPDTHIVRHLFGMDAAKDGNSLAYLKSVLWNAKNHHILEGIDRWYAKNHPAAQLMQQHPTWGKHFADDKEQANFPAFWRHWCSIAQDERTRGMDNSASNEFSTHEPFWEGISKYVRNLKKGELDHSLHAKLIALHTQYKNDHGEVPAQMMYYVHVVPHLLEAGEYRQRHDQPVDFIKSEEFSRRTRMHALEIDLRKALKGMKDGNVLPTPKVHAVLVNIDGKESRAGRFLVHNNKLTHLEDYYGLLRHFFPQGPVSMKALSTLHAAQMSPHIRIQEDHPDFEPEEPPVQTTAAAPPTPPPAPRPAPVWDYQRVGMDRPHTLESSNGSFLLDGNPLGPEEVKTILGNVRQGTGSIRYKRSGARDQVAKMEVVFEQLFKSAPSGAYPDDLHEAMQAFRAAIAAGHIDPKHERPFVRHLYEDPMTPGVGGKPAAMQFLSKKKPGVYISMDGNDFSNINNAHGHTAGDAAITSFGQAAREAMDEAVGRGPDGGKLFRNPDEQDLYRNGGDEFIAHVPSHEHAAKFARLLSQKLEKLPPVGGTHKLSMSFGFGNDHEAADKALYSAKDQKYKPGFEHLPQRERPRAIPVGQVPSLAHSAVPGFEGPVPVHSQGASAVNHVMSEPKVSAPKVETAAPAAPAAL